MSPWLRRLLWTAAFVALAARIAKGLRELDEPLPEEVPAEWPPLQFEKPA